MLNRRVDIELRKVVEEGKIVMRTHGLNQAAAFLLKYSVPLRLIARLLDEERSSRRGV